MASVVGDLPSGDLLNLCSSLARDIDIALASNHVPSKASLLPSLVRQVCQHKKEASLQSALTLLMISIKNACRNGWFHCADSDELLQLANEVLGSFCMNMSIGTEVTTAVDAILLIIPRFLPQLKLNRVIVSFEAKPGYDVLMADFLIQKSMFPEETVWLVVARNDDMQTSSCLIGPLGASFLVNGRGVAGRTNVSHDDGPQFPTDITEMLKNGTNIIQAVGCFDGKFVIAVASMSKITPSNPVPGVFVQPVVADLVPDSEAIDRASTISLNCPISSRRIKTPVKGHLCKHLQCFDYGNFMEMNSKKPSWHCPCCHRPISFVDLRIDENMVKILQDVMVDVTDVVIHPDGSWKVAMEPNGSTDQLHEGKCGKQLDNKAGCDPGNVPNTVETVVDPTLNRDDRVENFPLDDDNGKPSQKFLGVPESSAEQPFPRCETGVTGEIVNQLRGDIWSRSWSSASSVNPPSISVATPEPYRVDTLASSIDSIVLDPVVTGATSISLSRGSLASLAISEALTFPRVSEFRGPTITAGYPSYRAVPYTKAIPLTPNTVSRDTERQMVTGTSDSILGLPQFHSMAQAPDSSSGTISSVQHSLRLPPSMSGGNNMPSNLHRVGYHGDSRLLPTDPQGSYDQLLNLSRQQTMTAQCTSQYASHYFSPSLNVQHASQTALNVHSGSSIYHQHQLLAAQRTAQLARQRSVQQPEPSVVSSSPAADTSRLVSPVGVQLRNVAEEPLAVSRAEGSPGLRSGHDWRPTGRMRGSLTGSAYSAALNQYAARTSQ